VDPDAPRPQPEYTEIKWERKIVIRRETIDAAQVLTTPQG
jgi:hypothetical protein